MLMRMQKRYVQYRPSLWVCGADMPVFVTMEMEKSNNNKQNNKKSSVSSRKETLNKFWHIPTKQYNADIEE